jgi:DNA-binding transcriptional LysR family regulator
VASIVADAFRSHDMEFPPKGAATGPIHVLFALLASGPFLLAMSRSLLQFGTHLPPLKVLPVEFPGPPWPVGIMTLKNRTQSPVTKIFIECTREVAKPLAARHSVGPGPRKQTP